MKKKVILIVSFFLIIVSTLLIILMTQIEPISLKQTVFSYNLNDQLPLEVSDYASGSKKALNEAVLDISHVDVTTVDSYTCTISYKNKDYTFVIQIKDSAPPLAELVKVKWEIKVGETLNANDMIQNVQESSSYTAYFEGSEPSIEKTFDVPGTYNDVYIYVEDEYGNKSSRLRVSISVGSDQIAPILVGVEDKIIALDSTFDPLEGVSASDNLDGDITASIKVDGAVNVKSEDIYTIKYTVRDIAGNVTKVVRTITVTSKSFNGNQIPDIRNGLYLTKTQSESRYNYFTTINKSKITGESNVEKLDQLIKYLLDSTVYLNKEEEIYSTSYSVIVDKVGNQIGFASAFKYLCDQLEIPCYYVVGEGNSTSKAWNIVLYNGKYCHVDLPSLFKNSEKIFYSDIEMKQLGYNWSGNYPIAD